MTITKEQIAKDLLSIRAVFLKPDDPFTWASGIHSPIYCDNRLTLSAPAVRKDVEAGLAEIVKEKFPDADGHLYGGYCPRSHYRYHFGPAHGLCALRS